MLWVRWSGADSALWHVWQTEAGGNWDKWASLGGTLLSAPAAAHGEDGRMEAFFVGIGGAGYRARQAHPRTSEKWGAWQPLNGLLHGDPAVGRNLDGRLEILAEGLDGTLLHNWQTEANGGWNV